MADQIVSCMATKSASNEIIQYDVSYEVESGENKNSFCITVLASELDDVNDVNEVKTKANVKASAIKSDWVETLPGTSSIDVPDVAGDVTLS